MQPGMLRNISKNDAVDYILDHGGERNCPHFKWPKDVLKDKGGITITNDGRLLCKECCLATEKLPSHLELVTH